MPNKTWPNIYYVSFFSAAVNRKKMTMQSGTHRHAYRKGYGNFFGKLHTKDNVEWAHHTHSEFHALLRHCCVGAHSDHISNRKLSLLWICQFDFFFFNSCILANFDRLAYVWCCSLPIYMKRKRNGHCNSFMLIHVFAIEIWIYIYHYYYSCASSFLESWRNYLFEKRIDPIQYLLECAGMKKLKKKTNIYILFIFYRYLYDIHIYMDA